MCLSTSGCLAGWNPMVQVDAVGRMMQPGFYRPSFAADMGLRWKGWTGSLAIYLCFQASRRLLSCLPSLLIAPSRFHGEIVKQVGTGPITLRALCSKIRNQIKTTDLPRK